MSPLASFVGPLPALLAAVILATDRKILRRLREAGATSPARAVLFHPPGPIGRARLRRMITGGAVKETGGHVYLDEAGYGRWRTARRKRALIVVTIMICLIGILVVAGVVKLR